VVKNDVSYVKIGAFVAAVLVVGLVVGYAISGAATQNAAQWYSSSLQGQLQPVAAGGSPPSGEQQGIDHDMDFGCRIYRHSPDAGGYTGTERTCDALCEAINPNGNPLLRYDECVLAFNKADSTSKLVECNYRGLDLDCFCCRPNYP